MAGNILVDSSPHYVTLPKFNDSSKDRHVEHVQSPKDICQSWLQRFADVLAKGDASRLSTVLHQQCWWRDHVALDWDFHTLSGLDKVITFLSPRLSKLNIGSLRLVESGRFAPSISTPIDGLEWAESMFFFETAIGRGRGMLRLAQGSDGVYKAHMLYTALDELKGHEEPTGKRRPHGGKNSLEGGVIKGNWFERRQRTFDFVDAEPQTLIIGGGQAGLNLAAHLQALGISTLIVDKQQRIGDNWRLRYRTLVTHDPVTYSHMAYMPFPSSWPLYTPKDKLGDFFEAYASLMELNVWLSTRVVESSYSDATRSWTVTVARADGTLRTLKANHVVLCTGHSGEPRIPSFPHQEAFRGIVYHGSQHKDASTLSSTSSVKGKRVVVVGTGNSGHDIAQNYYENGANVTMLQRSGTYVLKADVGGHMLHGDLYDEDGPSIEDADLYSQSLPLPVQFVLGVGLTAKIADAEREMLDGLKEAGFEVDFGRDGSGMYRKYMEKGGGYYIDVGASDLICQRKIKVVQCKEGIKSFKQEGLILADGRHLAADIVVLATGYDNMRTTLRKTLGDAVANRAKDVWDLDEEGELNAMWRPSGHPRFWYMGGNLALCRIYSKLLALQIKGIEAGLNDA